MDFTQVAQDVRAARLAGRRFEKEGHGKYRDCIIVTRDGRVYFQRFNYGESAGLIFKLAARGVAADGTIDWDYDAIDYSGKYEAPKQLTGYEGGALLLDGKPQRWPPAADLKSLGAANLGKLPLWRRIFR